MGYQVIREPDGEHFAVFSSHTDTFTLLEATRAEVVDYLIELGGPEVRAAVDRVRDLIEAGNPRQVYKQWTLSWAEAAQRDCEHGAEFSAGTTD